MKEFAGIFRNPDAMKGILNSSLFDGSFEVSSSYLQPILKSFAVSLPLFLFLSGNERIAVVVGITYFAVYILTSFASGNAKRVMDRMGNLPSAINVTFTAGAVFMYVLKNIRRPMNVGYISEQISHRTMASGLSVESLVKTLVAAPLAPAVGWIADTYGVGIALAVLGAAMVSVYPIAHVR